MQTAIKWNMNIIVMPVSNDDDDDNNNNINNEKSAQRRKHCQKFSLRRRPPSQGHGMAKI